MSGDTQVIDLNSATWIGFANIGSIFVAEEDGWWVLGRADGAMAIRQFCSAIDVILREGPMLPIAEGIPTKLRIDLSGTPWEFRKGVTGDGVVHLNAKATDSFQRKGVVIPVDSVRDFPMPF